jgi:hypothetical protein
MSLDDGLWQVRRHLRRKNIGRRSNRIRIEIGELSPLEAADVTRRSFG